MQFYRQSAFSVAAARCSSGWERKTVVVEIAPPTPVAERVPTSVNHADVKNGLADFDGKLADLEVLVAMPNGSHREEAAVFAMSQPNDLCARQVTCSVGKSLPALNFYSPAAK